MAKAKAKAKSTPVPDPEDDDILTPREVAAMFRVDDKTVTRWARAGLIPTFKTPGGHRRYRRRDLPSTKAAFE